eukprot:gnl/MRDRNA2_/MRDRNA2_29484_c0_seq1.p1 gnl/MRDRNA2_/MRDRNA2_29484_c0~~gnl/MRDRNA2_/MRDRNA2_29484_c0_seq1.p1  ORF type:complete len:301 (+),score=42.42 gnl/MRDRNA2_/MRDRNA2_29484_c0_seq1:139-1041(+)
MAAADNLGTFCLFFPPGPILMILALAYVFLGLHHILIVVTSLMGVFLESIDDWGLSPSCQGSQCHEEWRDSFASCAGTYRATYRIRYLTVGIFGIMFGFIGFQGVLSRSEGMIKSFSYFWIFMIVLLALVFLADQGYAQFCEYLPRNMQLDVEWFISRESWALMRAQGYKDLTKVRTDRITKLIGFDWNSFYSSLYGVVLLILIYFSRQISTYADNVAEGPVGLGGNFVISNKPNKEIQVMANRMNEAFEDYMDAVPNFKAFPELEDGNAFPYFKKSGGGSPSINYGTMGIPRPLPARDD